MPMTDYQAEALAALDAAWDRAQRVVDPGLIEVARSRIEMALAGAPGPAGPLAPREADVAALIDQMLIDVAGVDDATAERAARHFAPGGLSDLVTASFVLEARTRLRLAGDRLLGAGA